MGTRLMVYIGLFLDNTDLGNDPLYVERWTISIIYFSFILGKVTLYTYRKVLKEAEMLTLFSQPVPNNQIVIGKYIANLIYISSLLLSGFFLVYGWLLLSLGPLGIPLDILGEGLLLGFIALSLGFTIPIFLQLKPVIKRMFYLALNIILIGAISIPVRFFPRDLGFFIILSILLLCSFILVFFSSKFLNLAWLEQRSKPLRFQLLLQSDRLVTDADYYEIHKQFLSREAWLISKKELISLLREKDAIMTIIAAGFLSVASVAIYFYYGSEGLAGSTIGGYFYPGILAIFLFLGTLMVSALIGLAMISMEGRALYIIKSMPINTVDVLKGKSLTIFLIGFPLIVPMAIILPVIAKFPVMVTIFFIIFALALIISFTGIGIWGGTRFPNFDPTVRNMPDLISQFFIMWLCIFIMLFLIGIPAYLMTVNYYIGLVAIIVALGWSLTIFIIALDRGQVGYMEIGSDMYM
jgi:ABC-2 type transport system permease protein